MPEDELVAKWQSAKAVMSEAEGRIQELEAFIAKARASVRETMRLEAERTMFSAFDAELLREGSEVIQTVCEDCWKYAEEPP